MRLFLFITTIALLSVSANAADIPIPLSKKKSLQTIEQQLAKEGARKSALEDKIKSAESTLETTQKALVKISGDIREAEIKLRNLESRIRNNEQEKSSIELRLKDDYGSMSGLITALIRMRRLPPEALIIKPGAPLQTAQTAMLLQNVLPRIRDRTSQLNQDLTRLQSIQNELKDDRRVAIKSKRMMEIHHQVTMTLLAERKQLHQKLRQGHIKSATKIARLSGDAKSLQDLLQKLEEERKKREKQIVKKVKRRKIQPVKLPNIGHPQLPVTGILTIAFGEKDSIGAVSEGITIESRPNSFILAPMGGIVRFAHEFKNYGNMIIIEHKNKYHSLIGGLKNFHVVPGQKVRAGEPVGVLPSSSSRGSHPSLYYELRRKGKPIDPAKKFDDLQS